MPRYKIAYDRHLIQFIAIKAASRWNTVVDARGFLITETEHALKQTRRTCHFRRRTIYVARPIDIWTKFDVNSSPKFPTYYFSLTCHTVSQISSPLIWHWNSGFHRRKLLHLIDARYKKDIRGIQYGFQIHHYTSLDPKYRFNRCAISRLTDSTHLFSTRLPSRHCIQGIARGSNVWCNRGPVVLFCAKAASFSLFH